MYSTLRSTTVGGDFGRVVDELHGAVLDVEAGTAEVFDGFDDAVAVAEFSDLDGDSTSQVMSFGA